MYWIGLIIYSNISTNGNDIAFYCVHQLFPPPWPEDKSWCTFVLLVNELGSSTYYASEREIRFFVICFQKGNMPLPLPLPLSLPLPLPLPLPLSFPMPLPMPLHLPLHLLLPCLASGLV